MDDSKAHLKDEYEALCKGLSNARKEKRASKGEKRMYSVAMAGAAAGATERAAASISTPRFEKKRRADGDIRTYTIKPAAEEMNHKLEAATARFFLGEAIPDKKADSPLFHELLRVAMDCGRGGHVLAPPGQAASADRKVHIVPVGSRELGSRVLDAHASLYTEAVRQRSFGAKGTKVNGFTLTSDGTTRFGRGVIDLAFVFKGGDVVFWDLKDTSGTEKSSEWLRDFVITAVKSPEFPVPVKHLVTFVMDGACRTSFPLIEAAFKDDKDLPNVVCQWCSCHSFNLLLKALADINGIDQVIEESKELITFVRSHDKPRSMLRERSPRKQLVKWVDTRFGTIFLCLQRLHDVRNSLRAMVSEEGWSTYASSLKDKAVKTAAQKFVNYALDPTFWNRIKKVLDLVEPIFAALRICDSDAPTVGVVYELFLTVQQSVIEWEGTKFQPVEGGDGDGAAFNKEKHSLLSLKNHADTGSGEDKDFTAADMVVYRWNKMHRTSRTGLIHAAGRLLNPALRAHDHMADEPRLDFQLRDFLRWHLGDEDLAHTAFLQWQSYQTEDYDGPLFYKGGTEMPECSWTGEHRGLAGADWWLTLPLEKQDEWALIREVAIKVLSQTSTESAAERHFSAVQVVQPKTRATLTADSLRKRTFVRAEILSELATNSASAFALLAADDLGRFEDAGHEAEMYHDMTESGVDWG